MIGPLGSPVTLASAVYSTSNNGVTLMPRVKLTASKPEELIVNGTLVTDTLVREIDGADDGHPGTDYIATISGTRCDRQRNSRGDGRICWWEAAPAGGRYGRSRSFACSR